MKELLLDTLDTARVAGAEYADIRMIEEESEHIETKNLLVSSFNQSTSRGVGIRVLSQGGWGFASTQDLSRDSLYATAARACELARASASCLKNPVHLSPEPAHQASWISDCEIDPFTVSTETKLNLLFDCTRTMLAVGGITLAQGRLSFVKEKKLFLSSEGGDIEQTFIRSGCCIEAYASNSEERQRRSYPKHVGQYFLGGFEVVLGWDLPGAAQRIAEEAVALLTAPQCQPGRADIILGSSQLGLQIHESCGHPSELDRALGQEINFAGASFLTPDLLGELQYGSSLVNLVADATAPGALGTFAFDDEGVAAQKIDLVKNGVFRGYLSSRESATSLGLSRSGGCMRAQSWNFTPIIRMTNISLLPGDAGSLERLVGDTESGILMETNKSWSIDSLRYNFQFSTEIAWEIKNGKRVRILRNPSYSGITPEFWGSCDAICGPEEYVEWGEPNCGKGQPCQVMWTGHGASPARFRNVKVGIAHA